MGAGIHGGFGSTLGSTYNFTPSQEESDSDLSPNIPQDIKEALSRLRHKGDYICEYGDKYSMKDVSIMSKVTRVEFAKLTIEKNTYIIRGDALGVVIPYSLLSRLKSKHGKLEFHSHPHNNDCIPSIDDCNMLRELKKVTGQSVSSIVTPNGMTSLFSENGVISVGTVSNKIDAKHKEALLKLFGGE